jgi:hypothetical protein
MALAARSASRGLQALSSADRAAVMHRVADALVANEAEILSENLLDIAESEKNNVDSALLNRLKLKDGKIAQLAQGVRSLADMEEPIGRCLRHTQVRILLICRRRTLHQSIAYTVLSTLRGADAQRKTASVGPASGGHIPSYATLCNGMGQPFPTLINPYQPFPTLHPSVHPSIRTIARFTYHTIVI